MSRRKNGAAKKQTGGREVPYSVFTGALSGVIAFIICLSAFSLIILKTNISEQYFFLMTLVCGGLSSFVGSLFAVRKAGSKKLPCGMFTAVFLLIVEFLLLLCFNKATMSNYIYLMFPISLFFGFIGCVIGINIRK